MEQMVGPTPATAMSLLLIFAYPATIAFGGVLTGKWNAILQANPAGRMRYRGWISMVTAYKKKKGFSI